MDSLMDLNCNSPMESKKTLKCKIVIVNVLGVLGDYLSLWMVQDRQKKEISELDNTESVQTLVGLLPLYWARVEQCQRQI